jgi:hypothetical protein
MPKVAQFQPQWFKMELEEIAEISTKGKTEAHRLELATFG